MNTNSLDNQAQFSFLKEEELTHFISKYYFYDHFNNIHKTLSDQIEFLKTYENSNKIEFLKQLIEEKNVLKNVFYLRSLNSFISLFIKEYKDFNLLVGNSKARNINIDFLLNGIVPTLEKNIQFNSTIKDLENNIISKEEDLKENNLVLSCLENDLFNKLFSHSKILLEINNKLLEIGKIYETIFMENNEEVEYSKKTKDMAEYFEKNKNIFSFFLSIGIPDDEKTKTYKSFMDLYNGGFLYTHFKDQLFSFLSVLYSINENIKLISYITPIMLINDH